jgi:hypothetical protein
MCCLIPAKAPTKPAKQYANLRVQVDSQVSVHPYGTETERVQVRHTALCVVTRRRLPSRRSAESGGRARNRPVSARRRNRTSRWQRAAHHPRADLWARPNSSGSLQGAPASRRPPIFALVRALAPDQLLRPVGAAFKLRVRSSPFAAGDPRIGDGPARRYSNFSTKSLWQSHSPDLRSPKRHRLVRQLRREVRHPGRARSDPTCRLWDRCL